MMTSMTGKEILQEEFEKAGMRGYKAEQVDTFLKKVAVYVDELDSQNSDLTYKIKILADKIEEYKADEENIREALLGAQKLGTSILNEAKSKSESMVREAKNTYDTMLSQAKSNADFMTKETLQKANSDLNDIKRECERERVAFEKMKKEVSNFKASILKQYKTHLDLLSSLPSISNSSNSQNQQQNSQESSQRNQQNSQVKVSSGESEMSEEEQAKISSYLPDIKPNYDDMGIKPVFFDQDARTSNYEKEIERAKSTKSEPLETSIPRVQTLSSEILTNEKELLDEEEGHTKEFQSEIQSAQSMLEQDNSGNANENTESDTSGNNTKDDSQEKFKLNMGAPHQRPNYVEKFGELKFGGFGTDNK